MSIITQVMSLCARWARHRRSKDGLLRVDSGVYPPVCLFWTPLWLPRTGSDRERRGVRETRECLRTSMTPNSRSITRAERVKIEGEATRMIRPTRIKAMTRAVSHASMLIPQSPLSGRCLLTSPCVRFHSISQRRKMSNGKKPRPALRQGISLPSFEWLTLPISAGGSGLDYRPAHCLLEEGVIICSERSS